MSELQIFSGDFWRNLLELIILRAWAVAKVLAFFMIVRWIAYRLIDRVLDTFAKREQGGPTPVNCGRVRTLGSLIKSIISYVLIFISGVMFLRVFDIDIAPVLTAAGVVGLAVGFGAQKLVKDIISGFFIVLENQYSVGDYLTIGAVTGTVVELGMRTTQLRDDVGKLVIIANGDITQVTNHSRGHLQAVLEVSVAPDSDVSKVRSIIDEIGKDVASDVDGVVTAPKPDGITAADACKITVRISGEVKPGRTDAVQTALRERILARFGQEGIKLV